MTRKYNTELIRKKYNISGQIFERLTVIKQVESYVSPKGYKQSQWLCKCECGTELIVTAQRLKSKNTKSCGCLKKELLKKTKTKHNKSYTKEYKAYYSIKNRCYNPKDAHYNYYGKKNIKMCDKWLENVENFINDVGPAPSKIHSIDRINPDGNYEPNNVRWATQTVQNINKKITTRNKSGTIGVHYSKTSKKWQAVIAVNKKKIHLGYFNKIEDAITARKNAEEIYHKPLLNNKN